MKFSLLLRYFTFWFLIISLAICINEYMGGDIKHLLFKYIQNLAYFLLPSS